MSLNSLHRGRSASIPSSRPVASLLLIFKFLLGFHHFASCLLYVSPSAAKEARPPPLLNCTALSSPLHQRLPGIQVQSTHREDKPRAAGGCGVNRLPGPRFTSEMTDAGAGSGLQTPDQVPRGAGAGAVVVVALRAAAREISKTAAVWALTHVVQHGDSILLLVLIPPPSSGTLFFSFPFHSYCRCSTTIALYLPLEPPSLNRCSTITQCH
jgi:hypothetical protein